MTGDRDRPGDELFIGVDLGKTNARARSFRPAEGGLVLVASAAEPTRLTSVADVVAQCVRLIQTVAPEASDVAGIGIGTFGIVDSGRGVVLRSGSVPFWRDVDLARLIRDATSIPTFVVNDVFAAAVGLRLIRSQPDECVGLIQLGTSVGVSGYGRHLDGIAQHPAFGQIAHLPMPKSDSWGARLGAAGISEQLGSAARDGTPRTFFDRRGEDAVVSALVDNYVARLASLASHLAALLLPDVVVIGGGLAAALESVSDDIMGQFARDVGDLESTTTLQITPTTDEGERGAAWWALTRTRQ